MIFEQLYIPHGSDNTGNVTSEEVTASIFISHMVQIILPVVTQINKFIQALYPTWFR